MLDATYSTFMAWENLLRSSVTLLVLAVNLHRHLASYPKVLRLEGSTKKEQKQNTLKLQYAKQAVLLSLPLDLLAMSRKCQSRILSVLSLPAA